MTRDTATTLLLAAGMLAAGALAWSLALRPPLRVDLSPLETLPRATGPWLADAEVPLESTVESMLRADFNLQRRYRHRMGDVVWVYFGYYGTVRGGRPEHTPGACFRAHGWTIEDHTHVVAGPRLEVNEMVVSLGGEQQLVHYWYRSFRSTGLRGGLGQTFDRLAGRLLHDRADGSLVRVSTGIEQGDRIAARGRLLAFVADFDAQLESHWPRELPLDEDESALVGRPPLRHVAPR